MEIIIFSNSVHDFINRQIYVFIGLLGDILYEIQRSEFKISAMQMFYMDYPSSKEFFEVYKGVVSEYSVSIFLNAGSRILIDLL